MKNENCINLRRSDQDRYIYRITSLERLYELFANRKNVLVRPKSWHDPFENFILKSHARFANGEIVRFGFHDDFYGQCWTLKSASDAMWRIYSEEECGVRLRTTVRNLAESLSSGLGEWADIQCFIGKVQYLRKEEMAKFANTVLANGLNPRALARTLLVKRPAFKHESEVRLLYRKKENEKGEKFYSYHIKPDRFVDQIMIDPRLPAVEAENMKNEIRKKTGFKGTIKRSLLYAPPDKMIIPVG